MFCLGEKAESLSSLESGLRKKAKDGQPWEEKVINRSAKMSAKVTAFGNTLCSGKKDERRSSNKN